MKHLLNNLTEQEKKSILSQHKGSIKVVTESFFKNINAKSGDVRPLMEQEPVSKPINKTEPTPQPINKTEPTPQPINKTEPTPPIPPTPNKPKFPFFIKIQSDDGYNQYFFDVLSMDAFNDECEFTGNIRGSHPSESKKTIVYRCSSPGKVTGSNQGSPSGTISAQANEILKSHCQCEGKYVQNTSGSSNAV